MPCLAVGRSLSAGALVFQERPQPPPLLRGVLTDGFPSFRRSVRSDWVLAAWSGPGAVFLRDLSTHTTRDVDREALFAHERVHVLQYDFALTVAGDALDSRLLSAVPTVDRYVKVNGLAAVMGLGALVLHHPFAQRHMPWEREAMRLSGTP